MRDLNRRKTVLRIGLLLLVSGLVLWALAMFVTPAGACCTPPENACCGAPTSGCFKCASGGSGGGGGGGSATPVPPAPTPGEGGGGGGGGTPVPPPPTATPPAGLPGGGFYRMSCDALIPGCPHDWTVVLWWCMPSGQCYVVQARCAAAGECDLVTPTPRPTSQPGEGSEWPCQDVPDVYPGGIDQTCDDWQWNIDVQVQIPPAQVLRNPWPRSLVGLPTKIWYTGAPNRVEAFSAGKAFPCNVDYGAAYSSTGDVPACPSPVGQPAEGTRVNLQLGAAWQRWTQGAAGIYGFTPPYESLISVGDRAWNGGGNTMEGPYLEHTFQTSSYGLTANGPRWNPACQDRDCTCDERVLAWDMPAYQGGVQTWWYPQWTWKYDELQCTRREWGDCFYRAEPPLGISARGCSSGEHAGEDDWYQLEQCVEWRWRNVTGSLFGCSGEQQGAWCAYDLRKLGFQPMVTWAAAETAGADASGVQCGSFTPGLAIPVIEVQAVLEP